MIKHSFTSNKISGINLTRRLLLLLIFGGILSPLSFSQQSGSDSLRSTVNDSYKKFRLGSYGEMLYQFMDYHPDRYNPPKGAKKVNRSHISIPRLILEIDYKFTDNLEFVTEIEFEHGGTGSAMELEYEEMGEYEMEVEKAGEVVLEQFWIKKRFCDAFNIKAGHMIVPIGNTNKRHLPTQFFTSSRPEGEMNLLPCTWHETGIAIEGKFNKFKYELQLINGLDANGFSSAGWIKKGKQGIFESVKITDPALVFYLENKSIKNLLLNTSVYWGNSTGNTAKPSKMEHIKGTVSIGHFGFDYNNRNLIFRGNILYGHLSDSEEITRINKIISKHIQYPRTPVAQNAISYSAELGYDILHLFNLKQKLFPFVRYNYYNTMEKTAGSVFKDARYSRQAITAGINYFIKPYLALKIDYSTRIPDHGNYNTENTLGVGLVFNSWFINK